MAVLVLGIGYIGAQLVTDLLDCGEEVVAVDNLFSTNPAIVMDLACHPRCHFVEGDFGSRRVLAAAFTSAAIDTVYCLAAQASAHPSAAPVRYTEKTNLLAPRVLLDAMRRFGVRSVVYGSSLRVYGERITPETDEDAPYGAFRDLAHLSKCHVEKLLEMYAGLHGMRCLSARLGLVYGLSPVMKSDPRFVTAPNKFCQQLARGEEIVLFGASGQATGLIHVADAASALRAIAAHAPFEGYTPVNIVTEWTPVRNVAAIARNLAAARGLAVAAGPPATEPLAAIGPRLATTSFVPRHTLGTGLSEVLDFQIARQAGQREEMAELASPGFVPAGEAR